MAIDHDQSQNQKRHTIVQHPRRKEPILQAVTIITLCKAPRQLHPILPNIGH